MSLQQQIGQIHDQGLAYFNSNNSNSNQLIMPDGYFPSLNKVSPPIIEEEQLINSSSHSNLVPADNTQYSPNNLHQHDSAAADIQNYSDETQMENINAQNLAQSNVSSSAPVDNSSNTINNTVTSVNPNSNVSTVNSTGTVRHLHPQHSSSQLSQYGGSLSNTSTNYNAALNHLVQMHPRGLTGNASDGIKEGFKTLKRSHRT